MIQRLTAPCCAGAFLLAVLAGCGTNGTSGVTVDRYDASLTVAGDGSLDILEAITVRAQGPADGRFARHVSRTNVDRISDVDASLDSQPVATSGEEVTWPIASAGGAPHRLTLHYRLVGALTVQGPRGVLRWSALPPDRSYAVAGSKLDLVLAPGTELAAGPELEGRAEPLTRRPDGATAELTSIGPGDLVLVTAEIGFGARGIAEPQWQYDAQRARDLMPAFVSAGVCLIGIGLGILVMIRLQYPPAKTPGPVDPERLSTARGLRVSGVVAAVLGAAGAVVMNLTLARFGIWPMSVPLALFVVSALLLWGGARMPVWGEAGDRADARAQEPQ